MRYLIHLSDIVDYKLIKPLNKFIKLYSLQNQTIDALVVIPIYIRTTKIITYDCKLDVHTFHSK